jgi:rhamnose utilization protein RhaD (predicted bifunctional aldolase and dehydrogenase)/NAD(P)-dependent dehydrogenase (short-subunit alcohol dehydrogenase family)
MKSRWDDQEAGRFDDPLSLRAYSSRLIGADEDLVLHGGGNTSVKSTVTDLFGDQHEVLYVKGSGWDLAAIEPQGFAPVRLDVLKRLAELESLSDTDMVRQQRAAMLDPGAPNPSVEAILHAIIPFRFVDHTHADAVVTVTNTPGSERTMREIYGDRVLLVPYVMPGFVLAKKVAEMTAGIDWSSLEGIVLMHHGVFSFGESARESYERMIELVDRAEQYLDSRGALSVAASAHPRQIDCQGLSRLRQAVSLAAGAPMLVRVDDSPEAVGFSDLDGLESIATQGPLTPDHVIRTKRVPMIVRDDVDQSVSRYIDQYKDYFLSNTDGSLTCLDPAPRWAVWPGHGILSFGATLMDADIVADIARHTTRCIQWAEAMGGWRVLPEEDIFEVEYWELEQAKIKKAGRRPAFQGKVALVTGAGSGIGKACAMALRARGAAVAALDIRGLSAPEFDQPELEPIVCDVTDAAKLREAVDATVRAFGGLDIVVSNAGTFPESRSIEHMDEDTWNRSLEINLSSHQRLLRYSVPYLKNGIDPAVVIIGSKNVPAPGPKASAYSVAKAGLAQLARVAAMELGEYGIRVNTIHPNAVFDTGIWSDHVLESRARSYDMSVAEYKTNNLLKTEVTSADVAVLVCVMAGRPFSRTTGAQVPIDGGNERVV